MGAVSDSELEVVSVLGAASLLREASQAMPPEVLQATRQEELLVMHPARLQAKHLAMPKAKLGQELVQVLESEQELELEQALEAE